MLMLDVPTPLDYMLKEEEGEKKNKKLPKVSRVLASAIVT